MDFPMNEKVDYNCVSCKKKIFAYREKPENLKYSEFFDRYLRSARVFNSEEAFEKENFEIVVFNKTEYLVCGGCKESFSRKCGKCQKNFKRGKIFDGPNSKKLYCQNCLTKYSTGVLRKWKKDAKKIEVSEKGEVDNLMLQISEDSFGVVLSFLSFPSDFKTLVFVCKHWRHVILNSNFGFLDFIDLTFPKIEKYLRKLYSSWGGREVTLITSIIDKLTRGKIKILLSFQNLQFPLADLKNFEVGSVGRNTYLFVLAFMKEINQVNCIKENFLDEQKMITNLCFEKIKKPNGVTSCSIDFIFFDRIKIFKNLRKLRIISGVLHEERVEIDFCPKLRVLKATNFRNLVVNCPQITILKLRSSFISENYNFQNLEKVSLRGIQGGVRKLNFIFAQVDRTVYKKSKRDYNQNLVQMTNLLSKSKKIHSWTFNDDNRFLESDVLSLALSKNKNLKCLKGYRLTGEDFIRVCKSKIETLHLINDISFTKRSLLSTKLSNTSLRVLVLGKTNILPQYINSLIVPMFDFFSRVLKSLEVFKFKIMDTIPVECVEKLQKIKTLKHLALWFCGETDSSLAYKISKMENLRIAEFLLNCDSHHTDQKKLRSCMMRMLTSLLKHKNLEELYTNFPPNENHLKEISTNNEKLRVLGVGMLKKSQIEFIEKNCKSINLVYYEVKYKQGKRTTVWSRI